MVNISLSEYSFLQLKPQRGYKKENGFMSHSILYSNICNKLLLFLKTSNFHIHKLWHNFHKQACYFPKKRQNKQPNNSKICSEILFGNTEHSINIWRAIKVKTKWLYMLIIYVQIIDYVQVTQQKPRVLLACMGKVLHNDQRVTHIYVEILI